VEGIYEVSVEGIYKVRHLDELSCHDTRTKFHKQWFRNSKVDKRGEKFTGKQMAWRWHKPDLGKYAENVCLNLLVISSTRFSKLAVVCTSFELFKKLYERQDNNSQRSGLEMEEGNMVSRMLHNCMNTSHARRVANTNTHELWNITWHIAHSAEIARVTMIY
jgi:hypothetical protein